MGATENFLSKINALALEGQFARAVVFRNSTEFRADRSLSSGSRAGGQFGAIRGATFVGACDLLAGFRPA